MHNLCRMHKLSHFHNGHLQQCQQMTYRQITTYINGLPLILFPLLDEQAGYTYHIAIITKMNASISHLFLCDTDEVEDLQLRSIQRAKMRRGLHHHYHHHKVHQFSQPKPISISFLSIFCKHIIHP